MKILLLFSGGLDSILSFYILKENGFNVKPVQFFTPFLNIKDKDEYITYYKNNFNITVNLIDIWKDYRRILTKPKHGYGKNLNPCLDCKLLFYEKAKLLMEKEGFEYMATGEVIGQRPFSQQQNSITFLEKLSGLKGKIIRPLSCKKSLQIPDKIFYNITGRGRKKQFELAKQYNVDVKKVTPAGGCLLTDPNFSKKCRIVLENFSFESNYLKEEYFEIIKFGRLFKVNDSILIVGKDETDNNILLSFKKKLSDEAIFLISENHPAPVAVIINSKSETNEVGEYLKIIKNFVKEKYRETLLMKEC